MSVRKRDPGPPIATIDVFRQLRWLGDLTDDEIVAAMHAAAEQDLSDWPELHVDDRDEARRACAAMTKSRLRAWRAGERAPTWLELRGLMTGLHRIIT